MWLVTEFPDFNQDIEIADTKMPDGMAEIRIDSGHACKNGNLAVIGKAEAQVIVDHLNALFNLK